MRPFPFGRPCTAAVDWEACMGCGVCVAQWPFEAVELVRDERKGESLDVRLLARNMPDVDQRLRHRADPVRQGRGTQGAPLPLSRNH